MNFRHATFLLMTALSLGCHDKQSTSAVKETPERSEFGGGDMQDVALYMGHGVYFGQGGRGLTPSLKMTHATLNFHISKANPSAALKGMSVLDKIHMMEGLLKENQIHLVQVLSSLKADYLSNTKGVHPMSSGAQVKVSRQSLDTTSNTIGDYIEECRNEGVPVPNKIIDPSDPSWVNHGDVIYDLNELVTPAQTTAELWSYKNKPGEPEGVCMAFPRWLDSGSDSFLFGLICLGTKSSTSCFFDAPRGTRFPRGQEIDIHSFVGGETLVTNGGGICSDCHAGQNPFVVHPDDPAFVNLRNADININPDAWPDPIVPSAWPQNPPPLRTLGPVTTVDGVAQESCGKCHTTSYAGQFPPVSKIGQNFSGYCDLVLRGALSLPVGQDQDGLGLNPSYTMPANQEDKDRYKQSGDWLWRQCLTAFNPGNMTNSVPNAPIVLLPPRVLGPLYSCATTIQVWGATLGATVTLYRGGTSIGSQTVDTVSPLVFQVPALTAGQIYKVEQNYQGQTSPLSSPVVVRDHTTDYPNGLPVPEITPKLMHECAERISLNHIPGATLTTYINGGDPRSTIGGIIPSQGEDSVSDSMARLSRPMVVGDVVTATQSLCGDVSGTYPRQAPSPLPALKVTPSPIRNGTRAFQVTNIVQGASLQWISSKTPWNGAKASWPYGGIVLSNEVPLNQSDTFEVRQSLCNVDGPITSLIVSECQYLDAPKTATPMPGDDFIIMIAYESGATITVFDDSANILGQGNSDLILLTRPLTLGEVITVTQQLPGCGTNSGYEVDVQSRATTLSP